jgi:hypothetical protein
VDNNVSNLSGLAVKDPSKEAQIGEFAPLTDTPTDVVDEAV